MPVNENGNESLQETPMGPSINNNSNASDAPSPSREVMEVTQTDHLNKKLLSSFLERINASDFAQTSTNCPNEPDFSNIHNLQNFAPKAKMSSDLDDHDDLEVLHERENDNQFNDEAEEDNAGIENHEDDEEKEEDEGVEEKSKKIVKPKRIVKNPQPKLNAETLKGARGLPAMVNLFSKQKFKGHGHEEEDLRVLLKTYEYWCHRMFPKFRFDESIERIEKLGFKKPVITYVKKIRMGLEEVENEAPIPESDEEPLQDTLEMDTQFDQLLATDRPTPPIQQQLNEEQLERIRVNKEKAQKLRQERLRKIQELAEAKLGEFGSSQKTNDDNITDKMNTESFAEENRIPNTAILNNTDSNESMDVSNIVSVESTSVDNLGIEYDNGM